MIVHVDGNANDKNFKIRNSTGMLQHVIGLKVRETYIFLNSSLNFVPGTYIFIIFIKN